jgi:hypothetical protein
MISDTYPVTRSDQAPAAATQFVEVIGTHLRISGTVDLHGFGRLSDYVSLQPGSVPLWDVTLLNRRGMATTDVLPGLAIRLSDLTLIAQREAWAQPAAGADLFVDKVRRRVMAVTVGHVVEGTIALYPSADLMAYLQGSDPPFLPLVEANVRWLADRRLKTRYEFVLLNRSHVVAFTGLDQPQQAPAI